MKATTRIGSAAMLFGLWMVPCAHAHNGEDHHPAGKQGEVVRDSKSMTLGEVRKINKSSGKITLRHEDIQSVEMPAMTMVFGVADKALLDSVAEGDKVHFAVKKEGGNIVVTDIKKVQ